MGKGDTYFYVTAFAGGLVSLSVELAASSLLRPHFGTANLVWATIIGLILLYLTVGTFLGGRWADRSPHPATLYQIVAWAGFTVGLVPFVAHPVLSLAAPGFTDFRIALLAGSFVTVLLLFSAPVILLGCISPFVIRLIVTDVRSSGRAAGRVYAVSTIGSFLGAFLPDLLLVPTIGTRNTFVLLSLLLLGVALIGLFRASRQTGRRYVLLYLCMPIIVILLALLLGSRPVKATAMGEVIYEGESAYNYIQVVEDNDGCRQLLLNEGGGIHSIYCPDRLRTPGPWDYFLVAPYFNPPPYSPQDVERVALIGLAAGTIARQYTEVHGPVAIDGVEIDPEIIRVGREYFALNQPNLNAIVADGRAYLAHTNHTYTVIGVDAYRLPYIPPHLTTVEFFQEARDHLTQDGVMAINVGRTADDDRLVRAMVTTLLEVFPSAHVIHVPNSFNAVVVATVQPTEAANLTANLPSIRLASREADFLYRTALSAIDNLSSTRPRQVVFTDDRASIELMTNALLLDFILGGGQ
ncbi:MAG: fused MFS/spermidine synthase [Anaerolineae bacterium]|jgi:predicted membrane-bound spermidine synthase